MMNSGVVTGRVYDALKREVMSGALPPGSRLDPSRLADALASSVTPVRDALYQLAGERMVDTRPSEGFFLPHLRETELRDRYRWTDAILKLALASWNVGHFEDTFRPAAANDYHHAVRSVFDAIGAGSANGEHAVHISSAIDRLQAIRRAEERALGGVHNEVAALAAAMMSADRATLRRMVTAFHRRRVQASPAILTAAYGR